MDIILWNLTVQLKIMGSINKIKHQAYFGSKHKNIWTKLKWEVAFWEAIWINQELIMRE